MIQDYIEHLRRQHDLSISESSEILQSIFSGNEDIESIVTFLDLLSEKGESVSEIVGFATVMRQHLIPVPLSGDCLDLCGTGGSGKDRFNISTATAFVLGALGVPVAKHGNRGSRKANGSFDFLEALDVSFDLSKDQLIDQFRDKNLVFLYARNHHPGMKYVGEARQKVGKRTIFNLLGPLCSPARVTHQIIGTIDRTVAFKLAQSLQKLGVKRAFVVVGDNQLDEFTVSGENFYYDITEDSITESYLDPLSFDLLDTSEYDCGLAKDNAFRFLSLISKPDRNDPVLKQIVLNAAMAQFCFGQVSSIEDGVITSFDVIERLDVYHYFQDYIKL